jgi:hypothetical protein
MYLITSVRKLLACEELLGEINHLRERYGQIPQLQEDVALKDVAKYNRL